jgi:putative membrane protein
MAMQPQHHLVRGVLAGIAGGLVASWVMNQFIATAGPRLTEAVQTDAEKQEAEAQKKSAGDQGDDATMKTADAIVSTVTGGQHLTYQQREIGGPIVHYTFGALMGGIYGGLAEYSNLPRAGFGTTFGAVLFAGADLVGVPAFHLSPPVTEQPPSALASPLAAHLVYGSTVELIRLISRRIL